MKQKLNAVKNAVSSAYGKVTVAVATTTLAVQAKAASLLPADVFTGFQATAVDTITDVMLYVVPIGISVAVGKAVLGWSKGGTSKALR